MDQETREMFHLVLNKMDKMDAKIETMDAKIEAMDAKIEANDAKSMTMFDAVFSEIDRLEKKMDTQFERIDERFEKMDAKIDYVHESLTHEINACKFDRDIINMLVDKTEEHGKRLDALEEKQKKRERFRLL